MFKTTLIAAVLAASSFSVNADEYFDEFLEFELPELLPIEVYKVPAPAPILLILVGLVGVALVKRS